MSKRKPQQTAAPAEAFDVKVRYGSGAYVTSTHRGHRTSCTSSAAHAALNQAEKVFGATPLSVVRLPDVNGATTTSVWRATPRPLQGAA